jgi:dipeptidyl-peptidase-4
MFPALLTAMLSAAAPPAVLPASQDGLSIEDVFALFDAMQLPAGAHAGWMPEGAAFVSDEGSQPLTRVDAASGARTALYGAGAMSSAFAALAGIDDALAAEWTANALDYLTDGGDALLLNAKSDLFYYRLGNEQAVRLTRDPLEEVGETLSPDGSMVAYISDYNLFVAPTAGGPPRALTTDGDENHLYGRLDWVYQEELYGRGNFGGFWWSPDSRWIAFLILDESGVPAYTIPDHRTTRPEVEVWRYPKAGDPNPIAKLAIVDVAGGAHRLVDLRRYETAEHLIVRVGWTPDSSDVILQVQDRVQTWLDVVAAEPQTGASRVLFRDRTGVWVEPTDAPHWVEPAGGAEGARFLWLSERDGWRHLYLYGLDGKLEERLTKGDWEVDVCHGYDAASGFVYFSGDKADVKGRQLFRVKLDGSGLEQITKEPGTHNVSLSADFAYFRDEFSSHAVPPRLTLHTIDGALVRKLAEVDPALATDAGLITPEFTKVKTRDGFEMEAMLVKPPGFDPSREYPVVNYTYSGPHAPKVLDRWHDFNGLFHQSLAQKGFLIWVCDNRSASGKGLESVKPVYQNLGPLELRDLEDGLDWLLAQGYADPHRVALWGWSYGGFMTSFALTHSDKWKLGIVGAPVTDWRLYDTIYTERYMGTPQDNPEGYARTSVVEAAAKLHGKALIVHGVIDENVHLQNTLQLAHALQEAGHPFELMLYPGNRHHIRDPKQRRHLYNLMSEFIRTKL